MNSQYYFYMVAMNNYFNAIILVDKRENLSSKPDGNMNVSPKSLRASPRISASLAVRISYADKGASRLIEARIIDISRGGACLRTVSDLPIGAICNIIWQDEDGEHLVSTSLCWKKELHKQWEVGVKISDRDRQQWARLLFVACNKGKSKL
jgi:hypothetical protein